jgi:N-hydroxyarylamine O-acetyltransferase
MLNLDAYLRRVKLDGAATPTLATLHALSAAHVEHIPFENLDLLLGRNISLLPEAVENKLITAGRGGYCFEQNALFIAVLGQIGFNVRPLSARVRWQRARDFTPPRTHLFARVEIDGITWLADVGVGGMSLTGAIRLALDDEQATPHEPRRIVFEDGRYFHQVRLESTWLDVCEFTLEEMPPIDRELANWFVSTHPDSHFRNRLVVARALPNGGRVSLLNRELSVRLRGQRAQTRELQTPQELLDVLVTHFGLHFPAETRFQCEALGWPG